MSQTADNTIPQRDGSPWACGWYSKCRLRPRSCGLPASCLGTGVASPLTESPGRTWATPTNPATRLARRPGDPGLGAPLHGDPGGHYAAGPRPPRSRWDNYSKTETREAWPLLVAPALTLTEAGLGDRRLSRATTARPAVPHRSPAPPRRQPVSPLPPA